MFLTENFKLPDFAGNFNFLGYLFDRKFLSTKIHIGFELQFFLSPSFPLFILDEQRVQVAKGVPTSSRKKGHTDDVFCLDVIGKRFTSKQIN